MLDDAYKLGCHHLSGTPVSAFKLTHRDRGQVAILLPSTVLAILAVASLVVDAGRFYTARQELAKAAEATAFTLITMVDVNPAQTPPVIQTKFDNYVMTHYSEIVAPNLGVANTVCSPSSVQHVQTYVTPKLQSQTVPGVLVTFTCQASFTMGALVSTLPTFSLAVQVQAAAQLRTGPRTYVPYDSGAPSPTPYARLIPLPRPTPGS
jgi:hypothetical protein